MKRLIKLIRDKDTKNAQKKPLPSQKNINQLRTSYFNNVYI